MKKVLLLTFLIFATSCNNQSKENKESDSAIQLERDLEMYQNVWNSFLAGDTSVVNDKNFTEDIIIVTSEGDLVGIEACLEYYTNYLTGFSEIEWTIVDAFGQGNPLIKMELFFWDTCYYKLKEHNVLKVLLLNEYPTIN